jgi:hypothetical protein
MWSPLPIFLLCAQVCLKKLDFINCAAKKMLNTFQHRNSPGVPVEAKKKIKMAVTLSYPLLVRMCLKTTMLLY